MYVSQCGLKSYTVLPLLHAYGSVVTLLFQGLHFLITTLPDHRKCLWFVHQSHATDMLPVYFTRVFREPGRNVESFK